MFIIKVVNFTEFPGPRHEAIGEHSGERFREEVLLQAIRTHGINNINVDLDGTAGYGSSFLEEAFGGPGRSREGSHADALELCERMIAHDDPSLIEEIKGYIAEAAKVTSHD